MAGQVKSVCIIEDDPLVRDSLAFLLRDSGYEVMTASDGLSGVDLTASVQPDFILTDFNMPGQNGAEVVAQVRARLPELPIIAMTGGPAGAALLLKAGADACLMKPFRRSELIAVMVELTRSRTAAAA